MGTCFNSISGSRSSRQSIPSAFSRSPRPSGDQFGASSRAVPVEYMSSGGPPPTSAIQTSVLWPGLRLLGTIFGSSADSVMVPHGGLGRMPPLAC